MVGLRELPIGSYYRTGKNDLVNDFYRPCLSAANRYDRAVGYFTSTALAAAAAGLRPFLDNPDSRMRLIASPALNDEDIQAISEGYELRRVAEAALRRQFDQPLSELVSQRLRLLTWLIAQHRLDIKLAVLQGGQRVGIYHEKVGIFADAQDRVVFTGSANESASGLLVNFESIEVFRSWLPSEEERVDRRTRDFEEMWENAAPGLQVWEFPEAVSRELLNRYPPSMEAQDWDEDQSAVLADISFAAPKDLQLREYQKDAVKAWWHANGVGIWEMATGTGKTITALAAVAALWKALGSTGSLFVCITVPFTHLANQWASEVRAFGAEPILAYEGVHRWQERLSAALTSTAGAAKKLVVVIVVNKTFCSEAFQGHINLVTCPMMLISDEAHTAGSADMRTKLPPRAQFRLGLSATPERHLDPEGTAVITNFFGESVYSLDLKKAIELRALVPYDYFPIIVELTTEEHDEYIELTRKIVRLLGTADKVDPDNVPEAVDMLLFRRARLIGSAANKTVALRNAITPFKGDTHTLVYCADRSGVDPQLNQVVRMLGIDLHMKVNTFTSDEDTEMRSSLLARFTSGELQALVAIRCLDEGIDVPATRRAFILASSRNPRQFIQRRGRVLRRFPGKDSAEIFDFIVSPPDLSDDPEMFQLERNLVGRELLRAVELCNAATNSVEALANLRALRTRYDLLSLAPD